MASEAAAPEAPAPQPTADPPLEAAAAAALQGRTRSASIDAGEFVSEDERSFLRRESGQLYVSVSAIAEGSSLAPLEAQKRKLGFALEMLQEYYTRNNPTASMLPQTELLIILISCLVSFMAYASSMPAQQQSALVQDDACLPLICPREHASFPSHPAPRCPIPPPRRTKCSTALCC